MDEKKLDKPSRLTRREAIRSWKRRREQDAESRASYYDLESVLDRLDNKIREHNPQRTVFASLHRGQEMTIDKSAQRIVFERSSLGGSPKRQDISYSLIIGVAIDYTRKRVRITGSGDEWRVSLDTADKKTQNIIIDRSSEERYTFDLAKAIGLLIEREVKEKSSKPDPPRYELSFDIDNMPKILDL